MACPGLSLSEASYAVGRTILTAKLQSGLCSIIFGLFVSKPHSGKLEDRKTPSAARSWDKHYVALHWLPITMGRANSTKSSMRTGQAPGEREQMRNMSESFRGEITIKSEDISEKGVQL